MVDMNVVFGAGVVLRLRNGYELVLAIAMT
jgi:hypothetical protein